MKTAILIIHRNDRPKFLENLHRMIKAQTVQPDHIEEINFPAFSDECDITTRYRLGYDNLRGKGFDVIIIMEVDDWYAPNYIETMLNEWERYDKPDIFGTRYTIYYHLFLRKHFTMHHADRASAMNTLIKPDLIFDWCAETDPYTDIHLWTKLQGITFTPEKIISVGIKHGIGKSGGYGHTDRLHRYKETHLSLGEVMDWESFDFYWNYFERNEDDRENVKAAINKNQLTAPKYERL